MEKVLYQSVDGVILKVVVIPNSSKNMVCGLYGDPPRLKLKIATPPVKGEANRFLVDYISILFDLNKNSVVLTKGLQSKLKDFILDADFVHLSNKLKDLLKSGQI